MTPALTSASSFVACSGAGGVLVEKDGTRWEAQFKAGRPCGRGIVIYPDGSFFGGDLRGRVQHGRLTRLSARGPLGTTAWIGQWCGGAFVQGKHLAPGGCVEMGTEGWLIQAGTFDADSELHGYGTRVLPTGVAEQGQFVHGSLKNLSSDAAAVVA